VPAFKNAVYWSNEQHWNWAVNPNEREKASFLKENIMPIQESGQLQFLDMTPNTPLTDNVDVYFVNGHTNNMMLPRIRYKEKTIVFMADLMPSAAHIPIPYIMAYDLFPYTTLQEKKTFLKEAFENGYYLYFEHDPVVECCNLKMTEKGIRAGESFFISDL
jgi:hypothetical protein